MYDYRIVEQVSRKKKHMSGALRKVMVIFAAIFVLMGITISQAFMLPGFLLALLYFAYDIFSQRDYEYTMENGQLTIDVIYGKKYRKTAHVLKLEEMEVTAPHYHEKVAKYKKNTGTEKLKKYEDYLKMLGNIAEEENNPECLMRVKRAAINCCRLYVGQIADSAGLTFKEKRKFMDMFAKSEIICSCWADYPVEKLPFQQRLFQQCMQRGHYRSALLLIAMRKTVKRIKEA